MKNLRRLYPYLVRYRVRIGLGIIFILASNYLALLVPEYTAEAIDSLGQTGMPPLSWYAAVIAFGALSSAICRFFIRFTIIVMSRMVEYDLRQDLWQHVQRLSSDYFRKQSTGDIMARLTNDVEAVRMFPGPALMYSIDSAVRLILIVGFLLTLNPLLTGAVLIPMPLLAFLVYRLSSEIHRRFTRVQEGFSDITAHVQQDFAGIRVIKSFTKEEEEIRRFEQQAWDYRNNQMSLAAVQAFFRPVMMFLASVSGVIVIGFGGWLVITNRGLTPGQLTAFMLCLFRLIWPITALGWVTSIIQRADAAMKRLNELFDQKPRISDNDHTDYSITELSGNIEFRNVTLQFDDATEPVFQDLSIKIPAGATYAIVGRTGCGKTSLVNLVPRLIEPTSGEVLVGGHTLSSIPLSTLRTAIAVAPQEPFLFSDSIANNIRFADYQASDDSVADAARIAQLERELASFSDGIDTVIGERGLTLSGGQKQRCALARAILAKPSILILDDVFSAVDTGTEEAILRGLGEVMAERTTLIISHRTSTVQNADRIIVIDEGSIAEQGTHQELIKMDGLYADLHRKQQLEVELEQIS